MTQNEFSECVVSEDDICDLLLQGRDLLSLQHAVIDQKLDITRLLSIVNEPEVLLSWRLACTENKSIQEFDQELQRTWYMPLEYQQLDIAAYLLDKCSTQEQLQRVGQELLLYQELDLFDLLRYLKYLVDVLNANHVIWGVGRGSSVASYVLFILGVHRIDSMYYDLDPTEFLRK
jgi:DNA polymerase III alpha subunit